ncbi:MAG: hypothetical protein KAJ62_09940 [Desulfobacteraceae bacterium]|nr:hypothetical protein [Desulfobacteraceae bacterium]
MQDHLTDLSSYSDQNINQNINENVLNKSMMQKRLLCRSEDVSTDLTIKTSEGDIVKLSTNSFYDFKSLLYDKRGQIYSDAGTITNQTTYREMTLKSGQSFTFSVSGNLNAEEMKDIKKIIGQIDNIVHHMKKGNMDKAIKKALKMGGYDTVSKFSADLSVKKSFSMISETIQNSIGAVEEKLMKKIKKPVNQLLNHHFKDLLKRQDKQLDPISAFLEQLQQH